ncbi:hypothetical protein [Streptomyces sp. NPDC048442]|uniref:hypothetical protein n=1 Tax=Streptomyces sp. NPDC048442 TaxID=3154823 RepID=UPI00343ABE81
MRIVWFAWLIRHMNELGYSNGLLPGLTGTLAVLLTAGILGFLFRRRRPVALSVTGAVAVAGIGWLIAH